MKAGNRKNMIVSIFSLLILFCALSVQADDKKEDQPIIQPQLKEHKQKSQDTPQVQPQQIIIPTDQPVIQPTFKDRKERNFDRRRPQDNPQVQPQQIIIPTDQPIIQPNVEKSWQRRFEQGRKNYIPSRRLNQQEVKTPLPERFKTYRNEAVRIRQNLQRANPDQRSWFDKQFFEKHHQPYHHYGHTWSKHTNWRSLSNWLRWQQTAPIYYSDEGYSVIISPDYEDDNSSYDSAEGDWLSLGVFAVGKNFDADSFFAYIQLSINRQGDVAGTYYNHQTQKLHSLSGFIDQESQFLVWGVDDVRNAPMVTVGVYNLTQDIAPAMIHFPNGGQQQLIMVRLNQ